MFLFFSAVKIFTVHFKRLIVFAAASCALLALFAFIGRGLLYKNKLTDPLVIYLTDNDNTADSALFVRMFENYDAYKNIVTFIAAPEDKAKQAVMNNEAAAAVIMPAGFSQSVKNGENEPFTLLLNEAQPLKKTLVTRFAAAYTDMLKANQAGIYAALDYVEENYPAEYDKAFYIINLRFLSLMLNRGDFFSAREVSALAQIPPLLYFCASFWVFINFAASALFIDILSVAFSKNMLLKLRALKINPIKLFAALCGAVFTALLAINAVLLPPVCFLVLSDKAGLSAQTALLFVLLTVVCASVFAVCVFFILKNAEAANIFVFIFSLWGFIVSGGVIPSVFFAPPIKKLSYITLNYWLQGGLLSAGAQNAAFLAVPAAFICAAFLAGAAGAARRNLL